MLEIQTALDAKCSGTERVALVLVGENGRRHSHREILGDVKVRQGGVNVRVYHRQGVNAHEYEETQVTIAAVVILALLEQVLVMQVI